MDWCPHRHLVAGAWLIPSASTSGAEAVQPAGDMATMAGPGRLAQAQAEAEADDKAGAGPVEKPVSYTNEALLRSSI